MAGLNLRDAIDNDAQILFDWVNEPSVRENSINKGSILWEDHKKWFKKKTVNNNVFLFILEDNGIDVGQIRFDKIDNHFEIDYSIDVAYRGKGYGTRIVKKGLEKIKNRINILAKVKISNTGSIRIFEKNGFSYLNQEEHTGEIYAVFLINNFEKK